MPLRRETSRGPRGLRHGVVQDLGRLHHLRFADEPVIFRGVSDDIRFKDRYRIPSSRLANWDYRWAGVYSLTICTHRRVRWFGEIANGKMALSPEGRAVEEEWMKIPRVCPRVSLDEWIVMPDHLHGILVFQDQPSQEPSDETPSRLLSQSLGAMVGQFKSKSTKWIRMDLKRTDFAWQTRFYDTVLREATDLDRVRAYIRANPSRWKAQ